MTPNQIRNEQERIRLEAQAAHWSRQMAKLIAIGLLALSLFLLGAILMR